MKLPSPLTQGRGLKHSTAAPSTLDVSVAPHAGAWIETAYVRSDRAQIASPLTQGRGLKLSG